MVRKQGIWREGTIWSFRNGQGWKLNRTHSWLSHLSIIPLKDFHLFKIVESILVGYLKEK